MAGGLDAVVSPVVITVDAPLSDGPLADLAAPLEDAAGAAVASPFVFAVPEDEGREAVVEPATFGDDGPAPAHDDGSGAAPAAHQLADGAAATAAPAAAHGPEELAQSLGPVFGSAPAVPGAEAAPAFSAPFAVQPAGGAEGAAGEPAGDLDVFAPSPPFADPSGASQDPAPLVAATPPPVSTTPRWRCSARSPPTPGSWCRPR